MRVGSAPITTKRTQLDLSGWHLPLIAASLALGGAMVWTVAAFFEFIAVWTLEANHVRDPTVFALLAHGGTPLILHLSAISLTPLTMLVALVPLLRRGDQRRALGRLPGVVACRAVASVLILEALIYPLDRYLLIYGELTRLQGNAASNIMQLPFFASGWSNATRWMAAVVYPLGTHAGLAALGVLIARRVIGLPPVASSGWNRLGLALGWVWVVITLGLALGPLS